MLKTFSGRNPSQDEGELRGFISLLKEEGVTRYLEIGSRHGDTFHEVMMNLPAGSVGVAVDLPGGLWGKAGSVKSLRAAAEDLRRRGYVVHVILGDSAAAPIISAVSDLGPFDAILIDGDHRYDGVKADWDNYRDLGRLIAFHDIVGEGQCEKLHNNPVEVPRLWREITAAHELTIEFISPESKMGIGVCVLP